MKTPTSEPIRTPLRSATLRRSLAALLLGLALAGCGNLTAGGLTGEAAVTVSGDAPDPTAASPAAVASWPALQEGEEEPEGEIEAEFRLFLDDADGGSVALSEDPLRVRVDVRGRRQEDAVDAVVPSARYTDLRIVFSHIEIEVESGLIIDGVPVVGDLEVELEGGTLTVTRPLDLDIGDGERVDLLVDLNAEAWITAADPDLRKVAEEVFAQAITVTVR